MASKKRFLTFLALLLCFIAEAFSQNSSLTQKLSWQEDKNAFEYKVEIRGKAGTVYNTSVDTSKNFIEVSLAAGEYEYRVYAYDFLGRQASVSNWRSFTVIKAVAPQITHTEKSVVPAQTEENLKIAVDVDKIEEDSKVVLVNTETKKEVEGQFELVTSKDEVSASVAVFPKVESGNWVMKVTNPSGLSSESEAIEIGKEKSQKQIEAEKKAEEQKLAAEAKAREEKLAAERKAEEERLAAERKAEEDRVAAEKKAEEERVAAEKKTALEEEKRIAAEAKAEEEKLAAERKAEEARIAAERKAEEARLAAEKKVAREEEKRIAAEAKAEEKKLAEEAKAEEKLEKANRPAADFTVLLGGGIEYSVYDGQLFKYNTDYLWGREAALPILPAADMRICYLPIKMDGWKSGFEIAGRTSVMYMDNDYISATLPLTFAQLNLVLQRKIGTEKLFVSIKAGASAVILNQIIDYKKDESSVKQSSGKAFVNAGAQAGLSLFFIPVKHFAVELGCDFNHLFIKDMPTGIINPYLVMGVRL